MIGCGVTLRMFPRSDVEWVDWSTLITLIGWIGEMERDRKKEEVNSKIEPSPQQGDLRLSGPPSGQDADGGARTPHRRVPSDLRANLLATVPPMPPFII
ncbi:hypothetical protein PoB_004889600 [Plakobranchus ocellatus]|uniref:Uncharacterized protein n=1 Tax=Plakobranchus ocellatus TaxID=259542 RepID=A0AAV4BGC6_9GAST|nr:hypothetical protein PoB_004889600 [Plakobranchus ocellatus]